MRKKSILYYILFAICFLALKPLQAEANAPITIMIDPGHGGENLGAEYVRDDGITFLEKDMTLITALAMKEELEKYEGISVYLTRETDVAKDISIKDRVLAAKEKNADYLICLHYNMSVSHILYGAEVWVPSTGELYSKSASLATEFMKEFDRMSLFHRGIKTRLNDKGTDYYGILRNANEQNIPTVLVEHCHLDNTRDYSYYETKEALETFGRNDATAVAKYLGLAAPDYGLDYSTYQRTEIPVPTKVVAPDITEPEKCEVSLVDYDTRSGNIRLQIEASDADSGILYYSYSYDNGGTYSPLLEWGDGDSVTVSFSVESGTVPWIVVKAYNGYDIFTKSQVLELEPYIVDQQTSDTITEILERPELAVDTITIAAEKTNKPNILALLFICFFAIVILFALLLTVKAVSRKTKGNRRRKKARHHQNRNK